MSNLFKRAAIFTDLHLGMKSNSQVHNEDCLRYIDWFIALAKSKDCDIILFLGDFHHNRNSININTMDYSLIGLNPSYTRQTDNAIKAKEIVVVDIDPTSLIGKS